MFLSMRERENEREINWLPPICTLTKDRTRNLGMCSDWGSNLQTFGVQDDAPTNQATWHLARVSHIPL